MPLKLLAPRKDHPNWQIRGIYLGQRVDRSSGTPVEATAKRVRRKIEQEIERGEFAGPAAPTFAGAVRQYLVDGGDRRFLKPLLLHFGETPLNQITQPAIDKAAIKLYPLASPATRNRQVYARVSVVLKRAGVDMKIRRPIDGNGKPRTQWLQPAAAWHLLDEADALDAEFGILCTFLLYTGLRLGEALALTCGEVSLTDSIAYVPVTKNGDPRTVVLPRDAVLALANHPRKMDRTGKRVFRFSRNMALNRMMHRAAETAGVDLGPRTAFHLFRHTWATWMLRFGGLDTQALARTGAWQDVKSAARYGHHIASEEALKAHSLPARKIGRSGSGQNEESARDLRGKQ